jgi:hypothetical protein
MVSLGVDVSINANRRRTRYRSVNHTVVNIDVAVVVLHAVATTMSFLHAYPLVY